MSPCVSESELRSQYYHQLDVAGKARYKEKMDLLDLDKDPYLLPRDYWSIDS